MSNPDEPGAGPPNAEFWEAVTKEELVRLLQMCMEGRAADARVYEIKARFGLAARPGQPPEPSEEAIRVAFGVLYGKPPEWVMDGSDHTICRRDWERIQEIRAMLAAAYAIDGLRVGVPAPDVGQPAPLRYSCLLCGTTTALPHVCPALAAYGAIEAESRGSGMTEDEIANAQGLFSVGFPAAMAALRAPAPSTERQTDEVTLVADWLDVWPEDHSARWMAQQILDGLAALRAPPAEPRPDARACICGLDTFAKAAGRDPRMAHAPDCPAGRPPTPGEAQP